MGIDSTGGDQVNLQVTYSGLTIKGVFNNDADSDASDLDTVRFAPEESDAEHEVWYLSDSGTSTGTGYSVSLEIKDSRIVVDLNN